MKDTRPPVVIFGFNRPKKLERVLRALSTQGVKKLVIFIDGPRNDAEANRVETCRKIAGKIDWAETELHFWDKNHGLGRIGKNISLAFEQYPWAVFIEDDCLPVPGFYTFMWKVLEHYQAEKNVFSIGGYQPIAPNFFRNYPFDLVSSARFTCWGWASWADRWQNIRPHLENYSQLFDGLQNIPDHAGSDLPIMARAMANNEIRASWDIPVSIATLWFEYVHLLPTRGLVRNIGQGRGTHGSPSDILRAWLIHNRNLARVAPSQPICLEQTSMDVEYSLALIKRIQQIQNFSFRRIWNRMAFRFLSRSRQGSQ